MIFDIVTYPAEVLLKPAKKVNFPLDSETKNLIKNMWETVEGKGIGLAAPQVGVSKKICIIHLSEDDPAGENDPSQSFVMINPRITFYSQVENQMVEGCLSFPEEFYKIYRPANIKVEFFDEKGKRKKLFAKDWLSRVIQHEIDHLNGKIFTKMDGIKINTDKLQGERVVD